MLPSCIASNANTRPRHRTIKWDGHSPSASEMKNRNKLKSSLGDKVTDTEKTKQVLQSIFLFNSANLKTFLKPTEVTHNFYC